MVKLHLVYVLLWAMRGTVRALVIGLITHSWIVAAILTMY